MWISGLSINGEFGVRHVMKNLLADFDILMNVAGDVSVSEIDRSASSAVQVNLRLTIGFIPWGSSYPRVKL